MTKTVKLLLCAGILCLAAFVIGKFISYRNAEKLKEQTAYALAHAPVEAKYMENPAEYARQYVFAKVPPPGEFYKDENYAFRLLEGLNVEKLVNGYLIRGTGSAAVLRLEEFSDWKTYLDFELRSIVVKFAFEGVFPVVRNIPFSVDSLSPELYGEILPDSRKSYKLKDGYPAFEILAKTNGGMRGGTISRYIFFRKASSHVVRISVVYSGVDGRDNRIMETAVNLLLETMAVKNQNAFSGIDGITLSESRLKNLRRGE